MSSYRIIRVCGTLVDLEKAVNASGGIPSGGPFWDEQMRQWCQAVTMPLIINVGEVKLREPSDPRGEHRSSDMSAKLPPKTPRMSHPK